MVVDQGGGPRTIKTSQRTTFPVLKFNEPPTVRSAQVANRAKRKSLYIDKPWLFPWETRPANPANPKPKTTGKRKSSGLGGYASRAQRRADRLYVAKRAGFPVGRQRTPKITVVSGGLPGLGKRR